ncbi:hypothetical protein [Aporhodopirellula aestuarii]|nr:hypothetical protein [Aporhodopirellula aestuarii]
MSSLKGSYGRCPIANDSGVSLKVTSAVEALIRRLSGVPAR